MTVYVVVELEFVNEGYGCITHVHGVYSTRVAAEIKYTLVENEIFLSSRNGRVGIHESEYEST